MSNAAAGSIIGKQGANITDLQNKSAARLQLSRSSEFFPGTRDRVLICSGNVDQVVAALKLVITAVDTELVTTRLDSCIYSPTLGNYIFPQIAQAQDRQHTGLFS